MIRLTLEVMTEIQSVGSKRGEMRLTEVFTLHETVLDRPADTLPCLFFVPVVAGTIEKTIASLDCIINRLGRTSGTVAALQVDETHVCTCRFGDLYQQIEHKQSP